MKCTLLGLSVLAIFITTSCHRQGPDPNSAVRKAASRTFSSFDPPSPGEKLTPAQGIKFDQADLAQVLKLYAEISGRSIIPAGNLPDVKFTFSNQTPMSTVEILQALDTLLAAQGVTTVFLGTQYVKVVPAREAHLEPGPVVELQPDQLPDSSSLLIYIVKLKNVKAMEAVQALQPFAKLPNSIIAVGAGGGKPPGTKAALPNLPAGLFGPKDNDTLILRDYASNVKRMLQVLEKLEQR